MSAPCRVGQHCCSPLAPEPPACSCSPGTSIHREPDLIQSLSTGRRRRQARRPWDAQKGVSMTAELTGSPAGEDRMQALEARVSQLSAEVNDLGAALTAE